MHHMAFLSKIGNVIRQTSSQVNAPNSMLQAIRCMSSSKLFVGGISYSTDEFGLREAFSKYGEVIEAKIIVDRESGRSRGFGFVTFTSSEEASTAMQLDGQDLHGRRIRVNYATERGSGFGGRGFGGAGGGFGNTGGYGAPAGGYGGGGYGGNSSYGGNAGGYGGGSPYGDNAGGGGGYGVAGGIGGSDNFGQGSSATTGFDDKFSSNGPFGNDTDHQLDSGFSGEEQFGGSDNQFGDAENGKTEDAPDGFDQVDDGDDVAKRA